MPKLKNHSARKFGEFSGGEIVAVSVTPGVTGVHNVTLSLEGSVT